MNERHRETTVVIASSEDQSVFNCIDSVNGEARIVVSLTPSTSIEGRLSRLKIPHVVVPRGNLGVTFNAGIELASTNKVIIMTDDATFNPNAIDKLSESLEVYDASKARIIFHYDVAQPLTKFVADVRDFINSSPTRVFTPGLALRKDIKPKVGNHFFNEQVRWGEDAEFSHRFHDNGLRFAYVPDATINHPAVSVKHDLLGAFLIGLSKRRSVDLGIREGNEDLIPTLKRVLSGKTFRERERLFNEKGVGAVAYKALWDAFYNAGYYLRRMGLSDRIEEQIWAGFRKDKQSLD